MQKEQLEKLLNSMGVTYSHTASRPTSQKRESSGRYTMTGDWVEEKLILNSEPDGVKIEQLATTPKICTYCELVVEEPPYLVSQVQVSKKNNWHTKCKTCKKVLDFATFMGRK